MAWKKESDTAAHHPIVTAPMTFVEWPERLTGHDFANLVWGVISRAATMSASYRTDYVVTAGTLANLAGDNWRHWVAIAIKAGYLTPALLDDDSEAWLLVEDSDDLFHIRRKAEIEWETRRKKDNSTPSLIIPVRLRDGDGCRYCGVVVNWRARRGGRAGTYDHRVPGKGAESPEDLRVACAACNGKRGDLNDEAMPPLPPPTKPFYGEETAELLAEHGHKVPLSNPPRLRTQRDTASKPSDPAAGRAPQSTTPRPGSRPDPAPAAPAAPATPPPAGHRTPPPAGHRTAAPATPPPAGHRTAAPATPPPAGHRTAAPATPPPAGHRTAPPGTPPATAPHQHKPRPADRADRRDTPDRFPGRVGNGSGSGREPLPPVPATDRKRSRGRRGRSSNPRPSPPAQPHRNHKHSKEEQAW